MAKVKKAGATGGATRTAPAAGGKKVARHLKLAVQIDRISERMNALFGKIGKWGTPAAPVAADIEMIVTAARSARDHLRALPADFRPVGGAGGGSKKLEVGATVSIRDKQKEGYEGLLPTDATFKVTLVKGTKLGLTGPSGPIVLPRAHVQVVPATVAQPAA